MRQLYQASWEHTNDPLAAAREKLVAELGRHLGKGNGEQQFREASAKAQRGQSLLVWAKYDSERGDRQQGEALWQKGTRILSQLGISQPKVEEIRP